jgi:hypothetical protein
VNPKTLQRFWSKVEKTETCWIWKASKRAKGYGAFVWATDDGQVIQGRAHRFAYELMHGPIPNDLCALHKCDNPACVNPDHIFIGTKADNNADMRQKGRHVPGGTHCGKSGKWPRAEAHHNARLTMETALQIRADRLSGLSYSQIAKKHKVSNSSAYKIANNLQWKQN